MKRRYCKMCGRLKPYHKVGLFDHMQEAVEDRKKAIQNKDVWLKEHSEWMIQKMKEEISQNNCLKNEDQK